MDIKHAFRCAGSACSLYGTSLWIGTSYRAVLEDRHPRAFGVITQPNESRARYYI